MAVAEQERTQEAPELVALSAIDGQSPDRIEVAFGGSVRLDRSDPADCALMRRLSLGEEVTLRVVGIVATKNGKVAWDEDGYPGEVTHVAKLRVTTVYRPVADGTEARVGEQQLDLASVPEEEAD